MNDAVKIVYGIRFTPQVRDPFVRTIGEDPEEARRELAEVQRELTRMGAELVWQVQAHSDWRAMPSGGEGSDGQPLAEVTFTVQAPPLR